VVKAEHAKLFALVLDVVEKSNEPGRALDVAIGGKAADVGPSVVASGVEVSGTIQVKRKKLVTTERGVSADVHGEDGLNLRWEGDALAADADVNLPDEGVDFSLVGEKLNAVGDVPEQNLLVAMAENL
jgi:hypothetical protein